MLKELENELRIAKKIKLSKREIENLERLIENEKQKMEKEEMGVLKRIVLWITGISLMAGYSYLHGDVVKSRVVKPKKSKTEQQQKEQEKKTAPVKEVEYELVDSDKTEVAKNDISY